MIAAESRLSVCNENTANTSDLWSLYEHHQQQTNYRLDHWGTEWCAGAESILEVSASD